MLALEEYTELRAKYDTYEAARKALCGKRNYVTQEDAAQLPPSPTNEERSAIEVYEFCADIPDKYFLYVCPEKNTVTTWIGDTLGHITQWGDTFRSNMGDRRRNIRFSAINGRTYAGTFYEDSGDYARVRLVKDEVE